MADAQTQQSIGDFFNSMFAHIAQATADDPIPAASGGDKKKSDTNTSTGSTGNSGSATGSAAGDNAVGKTAGNAGAGAGAGGDVSAADSGANPIGDVVSSLMKGAGGSAADTAEASGGIAQMVMALLG